jgi:hypothetical protein
MHWLVFQFHTGTRALQELATLTSVPSLAYSDAWVKTHPPLRDACTRGMPAASVYDRR